MRIILAWLICVSASAQNWDIDLLERINLNRNKSYDPFFRAITNNVTLVGVSTPVIVTSVGFIRKDSTLKSKGLQMVATVAGAAVVTTILKYSVDRTRPFVTYPYIDKASKAGSPSFPSGHTSDAFAAATSISIAFPKWYVIAPSFLWASTVAYSRMHLGVHYPTDVLAGAAIGSGSAISCYYLNRWVRNSWIKKHPRKK